MEEKFNNKFRIPATRLSNWDYGSNDLYYITICTKQRLHYFGDIVASVDENQVSLNKTTIGEIAYTNWIEIPTHHPFIELDEFILMPNHLHGIIFINRPDKIDWQPNKFGAQSKNLA